MEDKVRLIFPNDPDFEELQKSGTVASGADVNEQSSAIEPGDLPDEESVEEQPSMSNPKDAGEKED